MLDELMIRGADDGDVVVQGWTYNGFSPYAPWFVCRRCGSSSLSICLLSLGWKVLVWWLLSLWPCISLPVYHPDTSSLLELWRAVLPSPRTSRTPPWPVPLLKYLWFSFNQTATANMWVGPFFGSWAKHGAFDVGRIIFRTFSHLSSSVIFGCLSSTGFKNPSGIFIWTRGQTAPLMTMCSVTLSVILANALMLAQTRWQVFMSLRCMVKDGCDESHFFRSSCPLW